MKAARALVVDDDPGILEVLEMRLQSMGLNVALARNYREAVTLLDDRGFDVALFDLRMEPANGLRLIKAAHERQPRSSYTATSVPRVGAFTPGPC